MTIPTQLVLRALLVDSSRELYGVEIGTAAGLPSGTVHPIGDRVAPRPLPAPARPRNGMSAADI